MSGLECVVDAFQGNEKYTGIGLLKSIVRSREVSKIFDSLGQLGCCFGHGVCQCPDALASHLINIVHHMLNEALNYSQFDTFLNHLCRLSRNVCERPSDLFAHYLFRMVNQACVDLQDFRLNDHLRAAWIFRCQNIANRTHCWNTNLHFLVIK